MHKTCMVVFDIIEKSSLNTLVELIQYGLKLVIKLLNSVIVAR